MGRERGHGLRVQSSIQASEIPTIKPLWSPVNVTSNRRLWVFPGFNDGQNFEERCTSLDKRSRDNLNENEIFVLPLCYAAIIDSYQRFGKKIPFPFFKRQAFQEDWTDWPLKTGIIGIDETSETTNIRCIQFQMREDLIYTEMKDLNHIKWKGLHYSNQMIDFVPTLKIMFINLATWTRGLQVNEFVDLI